MFGRIAHRTTARGARCFAPPLPRPNASARTFANFFKRPRPDAPRFPGAGRRNASFQGGLKEAKKLYKQYPFQMAFATFGITMGIVGMFYVAHFYRTYIIGNFAAFPDPVAVKLRRALYFSQKRSLNTKNVVKYYRQALQIADELGMDPFSDEILGVKFQLARFFEDLGAHAKAIDILEIVKRDCMLWVDKLGEKHWNDGKRTRVLAKAVATSVKLGELYSSPWLMASDKAEESLAWAVTMTLKEKVRRETEGEKPGEGRWMTDEETGAAMESLGHHYEERDQHYLATPLFLQALALSPKKSCHSVVLMNNLATAIQQQKPPVDVARTTPSDKLPTRAALTANARQWATKALTLAASIAPPDRTEECDLGCAVATHNLGEFAEVLGDVKEARRRYEEARSLARAIGFDEGVGQAVEGLRRLDGRA